jgi:VanZ family protein
MSGDASGEISSGLSVSIKQGLDTLFVNNNISLQTIHLIVRKSAHVFEYVILGISYFFTARYWHLSILKVLVIGLLTATVDELLQNLPADRYASAIDIFIYDFGGFIIGFGLFVLLFNNVKNISAEESLKLLSKNDISTKKAYSYLYNEQPTKLKFTNRAHFLKLRIIIPDEKGVNNFLRILFFFPIPLFLLRVALAFYDPTKSNDIPLSKKEIIDLINHKGISVVVNASSKEKIIIKTI